MNNLVSTTPIGVRTGMADLNLFFFKLMKIKRFYNIS